MAIYQAEYVVRRVVHRVVRRVVPSAKRETQRVGSTAGGPSVSSPLLLSFLPTPLGA